MTSLPSELCKIVQNTCERFPLFHFDQSFSSQHITDIYGAKINHFLIFRNYELFRLGVNTS